MTFKWETEAQKTPTLFVLDGEQVIFAGAMLQKTESNLEFNDNSFDEDDDVFYELTLVS